MDIATIHRDIRAKGCSGQITGLEVSGHALAWHLNKTTARWASAWWERPMGRVQNTNAYFLANTTACSWKQAAETFGRWIVVVKSQALDIRIRRRTKWATSGGSGLWVWFKNTYIYSWASKMARNGRPAAGTLGERWTPSSNGKWVSWCSPDIRIRQRQDG